MAQALTMYLRRNRSSKGDYQYWTLVKSVRTASGPRQQIVASLGKLPGLDEQVRAGWEEMEALLDGRLPGKQLNLGESACRANRYGRKSMFEKFEWSEHGSLARCIWGWHFGGDCICTRCWRS